MKYIQLSSGTKVVIVCFFQYFIKSKKRKRGKPLHVLCVALVAQSCLTLCDPVDYRPPGSSVDGIF